MKDDRKQQERPREEDDDSPREYASPPCYLSELDPGYLTTTPEAADQIRPMPANKEDKTDVCKKNSSRAGPECDGSDSGG